MSRLIEILQGHPPEGISEMIKQLGGPPARPFQMPTENIRVLANILLVESRVRLAVKLMKKNEFDVFRYIHAQGGHVKKEEVEDLFPGGREILNGLINSCLVFENPSVKMKTGLNVVSVPEEFTRDSDELVGEDTLGALLLAQSSNFHSLVLTRYSLNRKAGSVLYHSLQIKEKLLTPGVAQDIVKEMSPDERALFDKALSADGILTPSDLGPLWRDVVEFQYEMSSRTDNAIQRLYSRGMLFPNRKSYPTYLVVPSDVVALLRPRRKFTGPLAPAKDLPVNLLSFGLRLWGDMRVLRAALVNEAIASTQKGIPEKRGMASFLKALGVDEVNYGFFLYLNGLHHGDDTGSPTEKVKKIVQRWMSSWDYLESSPQRFGVAASETDSCLPDQRRLVLEALNDLPLEQWVSFSEFTARVETPKWKRLALQKHVPFYSFPSSQSKPKDNRAVLYVIVAESLVWLGLVEIGWTLGSNGKRGITHIRLTQWGHFYLKKTSGAFLGLEVPPKDDKFSVLPHLDISVPPGLKATLLAKLFGVAVLSGPHTFTLTKGSIADAMSAGLSHSNILDFLNENSKTGVPDAVHRLLGDMGKKHGQVKVGVAETYVTVEDPFLVREILANKAFQRMSPRAVGERAVLFLSGNPNQVLSQLRKMGHFPVLDEDERI